MFSVILPGRPCLTDFQAISPTQFAFSIPTLPSFSHIVVFMLPGNVLPDGTAAGVYMQAPGQSEFKFMGAIGNEKPSAIFKVVLIESAAMGNQVVNLGISVEPVANIQGQLSQLQANAPTLVKRAPTTKILAQRIIKNAFNFLASFGGQVGGEEVVPLRSFQDWWTKFERRIDNDPSFLEREQAELRF